MANPRSLWKGVLKVSLVSIPARLYSASEPKAKVSFNRLHGVCKGKTNNKIYCPQCQIDIQHGDCVKGYEFGKNQFVTFTDEELDAISADASNAIEITAVTTDALPPAYIDGTMFLIPEEGGQQAFATLQQALDGRKAIATIVLRDRAQQVALVSDPAAPQAFLVYKLRAGNQVRDIDAIGHHVMNVVPPANDVALARQLFDGLQTSFDFSGDVKDTYSEQVKALLESKINGTAPVVTTAPAAPKIASLQDALAQSLAAVKATKAAAAKAVLPSKAAKTAKADIKVPKAAAKKKVS